MISDNTTLRRGCTYLVTGNILVEDGVTLRIQPGVSLFFDYGTYLRIDGSLVAEGNEDELILFSGSTWAGIRITESSGTTSSLIHVKIEHAVGGQAGFALDARGAQPVLSNLIFYRNSYPLWLGGSDSGATERAKLSDSVFIENGGFSVISWEATFEDNLFLNNGDGLRVCAGDNIIQRNTFENTRGTVIALNNCAESGPILIEHNTFTGNRTAIRATESWFHSFDPVIVQYNQIVDNENGVTLYWTLGSCKSTFKFNNIYGNFAPHAFSLGKDAEGLGCAVDATNNWWGTTNETDIQEIIYDYYDDFELLKATYKPFALEPIDGAGN